MGAGTTGSCSTTHDGRAYVRAAGHLGPDALAPRPGLPARRAATPSTRSGARAATPSAEHAAPDRAARAAGPARERARARRRQRARTGSPPRSRSPRPAATVTVLEAADRIGGAVAHRGADAARASGTTRSRRSTPRPPPRRCSRAWPLERHGLRWVHPRYCYAHPLPDGRAAALARDLDETAAALDAPAPGRRGRAGGVRRARTSSTSTRWRDTMLSGFPPVPGPLKLLAALGLRGHARLGAAAADAGAGARRTSCSAPTARARGCTASAMHGDTPPHGAGSAIAAAHLNLLGHAVGWPSPEGGAGAARRRARRLPRASSAARSAPARASRACRSSAGASTGVELEGGERVAARLVVADVTPRGLLRDRRRRARRPATPTRAAPLPPRARRRSRSTGRCRARSRGRRRRRARPARCTSAAPSRRCSTRSRRRAAGWPSGRSCCSASSRVADPTRAPGGPAHGLGLHARPAGRPTGSRDRAPRRARGGAGRALRARLPRPDPRPATSVARPTSSARNAEPRRRRRRRRQRTRSTRSSSGPLPACRRTARPCAGCTSAAPRRSPAARSTACPGTPPRASRCSRRACGDRRFPARGAGRTSGAPAVGRRVGFGGRTAMARRGLQRHAAALATVAAAAVGAAPAAAKPQAPGAPGAKHTWAPADKHGVSTARQLGGKAYLTLRQASLSEVYYPDLSTPSLRRLAVRRHRREQLRRPRDRRGGRGSHRARRARASPPRSSRCPARCASGRSTETRALAADQDVAHRSRARGGDRARAVRVQDRPAAAAVRARRSGARRRR